MAELSTQPYKGTRDFYPQDMRIRQWIFNNMRCTLQSFGYEEYDGPMLEPFELYASKSSEEIVNEQLYWLTDRGERKLAIRPEMTPTLARMVAAKQNDLPRPVRWFSIPNLWRYERPQRGRLREHWQLNVDVFGGEVLPSDLEICELVVALMSGFGATNQYEVRLNHRGITNHIFKTLLKLPDEKIASVGRLLDAALKMGIEKFREALTQEGLNSSQIETLVHLLDPDAGKKLQKELASQPDFAHLTQLLNALKELGIADRFRYDPSVMRGFLYYTGMVLEVYDLHPENTRALFGGGRYDNLVGMFGGKPLPGVGFGMGDVTFRNFLESHKLLPNLEIPTGIYIAHLEESGSLETQKLAKELREGFQKAGEYTPVLTALQPDKPKKIFTTAEKLGARCVIFIGSEEIKTQRYSMKDLVQGTQWQGSASELWNAFMQLVYVNT